MTDRRNRRDRVIAVIGANAVCMLIAVMLAQQTSAQDPPPPQTKIASPGNPAPEGIPRDLARLRAQQLKNIRYQLSYSITPKADFISGHEELRFVQNADDRGILPEWLDFREGSISSLTVNGQPASTEIHNGHVELPANLLKLDENVVVIDFKAPVAPAGKAITRFVRVTFMAARFVSSTRSSRGTAWNSRMSIRPISRRSRRRCSRIRGWCLSRHPQTR